MNRAPVREALRQPDQEGMTYSHPYRRTVVLEISPKETEEVFVPIRRIIENYAAKHASSALAEENFHELEAIISQMDTAAKEEDLLLLTDLDMRFHGYIVEHASSPAIVALWNNINARIHARLLYQGIRYLSLDEITLEHQKYLWLIREGDIGALEKYLAVHIY